MKVPPCKRKRHKWGPQSGPTYRTQCRICGLVLELVKGPRGGLKERYARDGKEVTR